MILVKHKVTHRIVIRIAQLGIRGRHLLILVLLYSLDQILQSRLMINPSPNVLSCI
jgi:hypothetical protein